MNAVYTCPHRKPQTLFDCWEGHHEVGRGRTPRRCCSLAAGGLVFSRTKSRCGGKTNAKYIISDRASGLSHCNRRSRLFRMVMAPTLNLVREAKIRDLMACDRPTKRWEASGVLAKDGYYFVVFDDRTEIGRFSDDLQPNKSNGLLGMAHSDFGYEGIAYNTAKQRFY